MSEADSIYVLDTGSEDDTVEKLRSLGAHVVTEIIDPWRFDVARNRALALVPQDADLCVCTDLDEVFHPGWRAALEQAFSPGIQQFRYRYTWNFLADGREGCVFWPEKIHARHGFRWVNPVHEVLEYYGSAPYRCAVADGIQLDHHADTSKSRGQYLSLLELAVEENPENDRNMHYLGREYMFRRMWPECEKTLLRHLAMPTALWPEERSASMRFLARAVLHQGRVKEAEQWLLRAIAEAPLLREPWLDASSLAATQKHWAGSLHFAERALEITQRGQSYINEAESWGARPYDLAAVAAYWLGDREKALKYGQAALALEPDNARLRSNMVYYQTT